MAAALTQTDCPALRRVGRGKVRDIFEVDDKLLLVTTDRISAFDVVLPNGIPDKGKVLNQLSKFWFDKFRGLTRNHVITIDVDAMPAAVKPYRDMLRGRTTLAVKAKPFPVECVARGYIVGSGWKDYQATGAICGIQLPKGLKQCDRLAEPIFTPATKAETGHDENISFQQMKDIIGSEAAVTLRDRTLAIYSQAREYAATKGILIADTKLEWGTHDGEIILIDEALTPDSSRFWPADQYKPGSNPPSFDKQYVRDYLETLDWNKTAPGPMLPPDVAEKTAEKYREAYQRLTGHPLPE